MASQRIFANTAVLLALVIGASGGCNLVLGIHDLQEGSPSEDAGVPCEVDAQCDDSNPCTVDTCKGGVCEHLAQQDGPAPSAAQVAFDCQVLMCVNGLPEPQNDDQDIKADAEDCTFDSCSGGQTFHTAKPDMTACTMGSDGICQGGKCRAPCLSDAVCDDKNSCTQDSCDVVNGWCSFVPIKGMSSTPEVCDDGLDNDCDGMVDCSDTDCTGVLGYACSPAAPAGWTVVVFKNDPAVQCPTGYQNPRNVTTSPTSANSSCSCNCGAASADICTKGALSVQFGYNSCASKKFSLTVTGGCDSIGSLIGTTGQGFYKDANATGPGVMNAACIATPSAPPALQATEGISCTPSSAGGKGCGNDSACLPKVDAAAWCIEKAGDMPCPDAAFTQRQVVYAKSDVTDNRSCGSCSCMSNAIKCTNGKFTSFSNAQCSGTGVSLDVGVGCKDFIGDNQSHAYFKYTSVPDTMSCKVTTPSVLNGTVEVKNPITLCCP
jgi:hypothetical protein